MKKNKTTIFLLIMGISFSSLSWSGVDRDCKRWEKQISDKAEKCVKGAEKVRSLQVQLDVDKVTAETDMLDRQLQCRDLETKKKLRCPFKSKALAKHIKKWSNEEYKKECLYFLTVASEFDKVAEVTAYDDELVAKVSIRQGLKSKKYKNKKIYTYLEDCKNRKRPSFTFVLFDDDGQSCIRGKKKTKAPFGDDKVNYIVAEDVAFNFINEHFLNKSKKKNFGSLLLKNAIYSCKNSKDNNLIQLADNLVKRQSKLLGAKFSVGTPKSTSSPSQSSGATKAGP